MAGMVMQEHRVLDVYTVDDLDAMPDDGIQRELLDGLLLVTPGPTTSRCSWPRWTGVRTGWRACSQTSSCSREITLVPADLARL